MRGAIYHHFKSKDEIVNAVVNRLFPEIPYFNYLNEREDLNGIDILNEETLSALSSLGKELNYEKHTNHST